MKSPALRESMRPLVRLEAKARESYDEAITQWRRAQELHKLKREAAEIPQMPRAIKYAWGVGVTLLVGLSLVVDRGSMFEIQPSFGKALITCLARMNGKVVGVIANNPMIYGGAVDVRAARKQTHFIELCDCFHIPLIFLVDVPGFMVGKDAEAAATLREGMRSVYVGLQASVPMYTVVIRKCYGMAGMGATDKNGLDLKIAWPTAEWGSLPVEGGVAAAFRREIAEAADPQAALDARVAEYTEKFANPYIAAARGYVDDVIEPRETRPRLIEALATLRGKRDRNPPKKHGNLPL
jgi:acetyl-CoA carboxylase carboxyltransferase component